MRYSCLESDPDSGQVVESRPDGAGRWSIPCNSVSAQGIRLNIQQSGRYSPATVRCVKDAQALRLARTLHEDFDASFRIEDPMRIACPCLICIKNVAFAVKPHLIADTSASGLRRPR